MLFALPSRGLFWVRRSAGFTLIELIFVVAILAILLAIAYPSFIDQVRKSRRADAAASLMSTAQAMERCFTRTNSYSSCVALPAASVDGHYTIQFADGEPTASTYELEADPTGDQENDPCGMYTLDHLGNKNAPESTVPRCWGS
jgi:type IV pilus assembly protein PilE